MNHDNTQLAADEDTRSMKIEDEQVGSGVSAVEDVGARLPQQQQQDAGDNSLSCAGNAPISNSSHTDRDLFAATATTNSSAKDGDSSSSHQQHTNTTAATATNQFVSRNYYAQDVQHPIHSVAFHDDGGASTCTGLSSITGLPGEDLLGVNLYPNSFALLQAELPESQPLVLPQQQQQQQLGTAAEAAGGSIQKGDDEESVMEKEQRSNEAAAAVPSDEAMKKEAAFASSSSAKSSLEIEWDDQKPAASAYRQDMEDMDQKQKAANHSFHPIIGNKPSTPENLVALEERVVRASERNSKTAAAAMRPEGVPVGYIQSRKGAWALPVEQQKQPGAFPVEGSAASHQDDIRNQNNINVGVGVVQVENENGRSQEVGRDSLAQEGNDPEAPPPLPVNDPGMTTEEAHPSAAAEANANDTPSKSQNRYARSNLMLAGFLVLVGIVVIVSAVVIATSHSNANSSSFSSPSSSNNNNIDVNNPEERRRQDIQARLGATFSVMVEQGRLRTDHHESALQWIIETDPLQLDATTENLMQRYYLALFYISTTDPEEGIQWKSCNPLILGNYEDTMDAPTTLPPPQPQPQQCLYNSIMTPYQMNSGDVDAPTPVAMNYRDETAGTFAEGLKASLWLSNTHECSWAGVFCNAQDRVQFINLANMNLIGTIPPGIGVLDDLESLSLSYNNLGGTLRSMASLTNLVFLDVEGNMLTGSPMQICMADNEEKKKPFDRLEYFRVAHNPFHAWTIPTELSSCMPNLERLFLQATSLTGTLPSDISELSRLRQLALMGNELTSTLPTEVGGLPNMTDFSIGYTMISGTIPTEITQWENLRTLDLANAALTGTIPEELYLAQFRDLEALVFSQNFFTGTISTLVGQLDSIDSLYYSLNPFLEGTVPTELGNLTGLSKIHLHGSGFTGSIPAELCSLRQNSNLTVLKADCSADTNTGVIPTPCAAGCCTKCCEPNTGYCIDV